MSVEVKAGLRTRGSFSLCLILFHLCFEVRSAELLAFLFCFVFVGDEWIKST